MNVKTVDYPDFDYNYYKADKQEIIFTEEFSTERVNWINTEKDKDVNDDKTVDDKTEEIGVVDVSEAVEDRVGDVVKWGGGQSSQPVSGTEVSSSLSVDKSTNIAKTEFNSLSDDKSTQNNAGNMIIFIILFLTGYCGIILFTLGILIFVLPIALIIEYIILKCKGRDLIHCPFTIRKD